jgi:hypothetical protein
MGLRTGDVKCFLAASLVALHARTRGRLRLPSAHLAQIAHLMQQKYIIIKKISLVRQAVLRIRDILVRKDSTPDPAFFDSDLQDGN